MRASRVMARGSSASLLLRPPARLLPPLPASLTSAARRVQVGLDVWVRDGNVFTCWTSMWDVIWHGELGSSLALLNAGEPGMGGGDSGRAWRGAALLPARWPEGCARRCCCPFLRFPEPLTFHCPPVAAAAVVP